LGRTLLAVPGPVNSRTSRGTLELLRHGAMMAIDPDDILSCFDIPDAVGKKISQEDRILLDELLKCPQDIDELSETLRWNAQVTGRKLSVLLLEGLIYEENGRYAVAQKGGV